MGQMKPLTCLVLLSFLFVYATTAAHLRALQDLGNGEETTTISEGLPNTADDALELKSPLVETEELPNPRTLEEVTSNEVEEEIRQGEEQEEENGAMRALGENKKYGTYYGYSSKGKHHQHYEKGHVKKPYYAPKKKDHVYVPKKIHFVTEVLPKSSVGLYAPPLQKVTVVGVVQGKEHGTPFPLETNDP